MMASIKMLTLYLYYNISPIMQKLNPHSLRVGNFNTLFVKRQDKYIVVEYLAYNMARIHMLRVPQVF